MAENPRVASQRPSRSAEEREKARKVAFRLAVALGRLASLENELAAVRGRLEHFASRNAELELRMAEYERALVKRDALLQTSAAHGARLQLDSLEASLLLEDERAKNRALIAFLLSVSAE
jgi:hypothetical protein